MKLPKYRAWSKTEKTMSDVIRIDFLNEEVDAFSFEENETEKVEFMSSTGLFDKNGTEIFEGDILADVDESGDEVLGNAKLVWNKWQAVLVVEAIGVEDATAFSELIDDISSYRVIGNIYENPELLG